MMNKFTKDMLNSRFEMKDISLDDAILKFKILRTSDVLVLSQSHFMEKFFKKFNNDDSSMVRTSIYTS